MSVAVVDVNSDNKPDIVVANQGSNSTGVLLNIGNGIFGPQAAYATDPAPYSAAVADVNGNNKPDIVVTNWSSSTVGVLLNQRWASSP